MSTPDLHALVHRRGTVIVQVGDPLRSPEWKVFSDPRRVFETTHIAEVRAVLESVAGEVRNGRHAAGFIAYEAASAFDPALRTRDGVENFPLIWFGIYDSPFVLNHLQDASADFRNTLQWTGTPDFADYEQTITRLRQHIASGNTYQVNYTHRLTADFDADPWPLFLMLCRAQRSRYSTYMRTDSHTICSVSPELFFEKDGRAITCRPMKGTAARGMNAAEDRERAAALAQSVKDRAENVMIVDMVRNDLGKIAVPGSIRVPDLFSVERYDTVFQMTSTVTAQTDHSIPDVIAALFPCASVTGAPKVRTMQIIAEEETTPRGIYTGCIGFLSPPNSARFSVAIRTVQVDHHRGRAAYGTGGGIVWDSNAAAEYAECRTKAQVLFESRPPFSLIETIRWERETGFFLLKRHLERLGDSAEYFDIPCDESDIRKLLTESEKLFTDDRAIVRVLLTENGMCTIKTDYLRAAISSEIWRVTLARNPVSAQDRFLYHKTTNRVVYDNARGEFPECDDVILWNTRGEITESTRANIVLKRKGRMVTPAASSGLLAGVFREQLLESGEVEEEKLDLCDLLQADAVYLVNSVRGWITAKLHKA